MKTEHLAEQEQEQEKTIIVHLSFDISTVRLNGFALSLTSCQAANKLR
jgi:hypothetical protein